MDLRNWFQSKTISTQSRGSRLSESNDLFDQNFGTRDKILRIFFSALSSVARKWQKMAKLCPRLFSPADLLLDTPIRRNLDINRHWSRNFRQCTAILAFHDVFFTVTDVSQAWHVDRPLAQFSKFLVAVGVLVVMLETAARHWPNCPIASKPLSSIKFLIHAWSSY